MLTCLNTLKRMYTYTRAVKGAVGCTAEVDHSAAAKADSLPAPCIRLVGANEMNYFVMHYYGRFSLR